MSHLPRVHQKIYGEIAGAAGNFIQFGSLAANAPLYTKDLDVIQALDAFRLAWVGAVVGNNSPSLEDMNSLFLLGFSQIAYILQTGVPEWNAQTDYYINQMCRIGAVMYLSKTDNNVNNNPTSDTNNWRDKRSFDLEFRYPVGEVFQTHLNGNPYALLGFGVWERIAEGQMPVGLSTTDVDFNAIGKTGGEKTHVLTIPEMPSHSHQYNRAPSRIGQAGANPIWANDETSNTGETGGNQPHNNMPPYNVLFNYWLRTA